jgi:hypothetical protein
MYYVSTLQVVFAAIWYVSMQVSSASSNGRLREASPLIVTLVSFWHFAVWRQQTLTPSIAFTSVSLSLSFHFMFTD